MASLEERIDRLESLDAIRQLPAKYALALDMRDMDAMVSLFPVDVRVERIGLGDMPLGPIWTGRCGRPLQEHPTT